MPIKGAAPLGPPRRSFGTGAKAVLRAGPGAYRARGREARRAAVLREGRLVKSSLVTN